MKIIHTADLHLDSVMKKNLDKERAAKRKSELLETFGRMVDYGASHGVSAVIIAGDMFDRPVSKVTKTAKNMVMDTILKNPDISFYYLKGNHDEGDMSLEFEKLPDNLYLFDEKWKEYRIGRRVMLYGAELMGENNTVLFNSLLTDPSDINIVTLHGMATRFGNEGDRDAISLSDLKNKSIDYLALGHIHGYSRDELDGRGVYCYCGCPEPRGFDEPGDHGFVMLNINEETGELTDTFVPFASRNAYICHCDVTGAATTAEAVDIVKEEFDKQGYRPDDMVELYLEGYIDAGTEIDEVFILNHFESDFFAFKCKNLTKVKIDYDAFELDPTLKGEFVGLVRENTEIDEDEKGRIISLGIALLQNPAALKE